MIDREELLLRLEREDLQKLLAEKEHLQRELFSEIHKIRRQLILVCDHSSTEDYKWEWDSGYGRQTQEVGKRCSYCLYIDLWNRGHFVSPSEVTV
jgi:hypothetical protein